MTKSMRTVCLLLIVTLLAGPALAADPGAEERPVHQRIWSALGELAAKLGFAPEAGPAERRTDGEATPAERTGSPRFRAKLGGTCEPGGGGS